MEQTNSCQRGGCCGGLKESEGIKQIKKTHMHMLYIYIKHIDTANSVVIARGKGG